MHRRLAIELLQKVNNPSHMFTDLEVDEDGVGLSFLFNFINLGLLLSNTCFSLQSVPNVPQRIASRLTSRPKPRTPLQPSPDIQTFDEANNTLQRPGNNSTCFE